MVRDFNCSRGKRFPLLPNSPDLLWGTPSLLFGGCWGYFLGVKQVGCDVDCSPLSGAEVKNKWSYTCAPFVCFHGVDGDSCTSPTCHNQIPKLKVDPLLTVINGHIVLSRSPLWLTMVASSALIFVEQ
jgi:hypothetical protein